MNKTQSQNFGKIVGIYLLFKGHSEATIVHQHNKILVIFGLRAY